MSVRCRGPGFPIFFVQEISNNILGDIPVFREIEKFVDSARSFEPQTPDHSRIILSFVFSITRLF
jgi:hypothetical protein